MEEWERLSDWIVAMDTGGRFSCSTRGDMGSIGEVGQVEDLMMGRVSVREDRDEIEVVDIVEVMNGIEEVGMKLG